MTMLLEPFGSLLETPRRRQSRADGARDFFPAADLVASEEEVTLVMDVPGLRSEDLEVELVDRMLRIRGERRYPYGSGEAGRRIHRLERGYGRFERILQVPEGVDPGALAASIEDGVLTLRIPVPEARKAHRIEIRDPEAKRVIDAEWSTEGVHPASEKAEEEEEGRDRELAVAGA
jgi:HSP20 family protein